MSKIVTFLTRALLCAALAVPAAVTISAPANAGAANTSELKCLADALYFEARGESASGQKAVAEVILNRRDSGRFPGTVCGVVKQGNRGGCQFSYNCGGSQRAIRERGAYQRVHKVAQAALSGAPRTLTNGATYFHTTGVRPSWAKRFARTTKIGSHIFYTDRRRVASN